MLLLKFTEREARDSDFWGLMKFYKKYKQTGVGCQLTMCGIRMDRNSNKLFVY